MEFRSRVESFTVEAGDVPSVQLQRISELARVLRGASSVQDVWIEAKADRQRSHVDYPLHVDPLSIL